MLTLRQARHDDLDALYQICLVTGASGQDASSLHNDPQLIGHIYVAPYVVIEPEHALVAEDEGGVAGYLVGTLDTDRFAAKLEQRWWPALRDKYRDSTLDLTPADRRRVHGIMTPDTNPPELVARYPAHIHMNLLPRLRGHGVGRALTERWVAGARAAKVKGIHLGAGASNTGGRAFWAKVGFTPLWANERSAWFGMALD
jgi:GNAT superfamily N-acetyltransferase